MAYNQTRLKDEDYNYIFNDLILDKSIKTTKTNLDWFTRCLEQKYFLQINDQTYIINNSNIARRMNRPINSVISPNETVDFRDIFLCQYLLVLGLDYQRQVKDLKRSYDFFSDYACLNTYDQVSYHRSLITNSSDKTHDAFTFAIQLGNPSANAALNSYMFHHDKFGLFRKVFKNSQPEMSESYKYKLK